MQETAASQSLVDAPHALHAASTLDMTTLYYRVVRSSKATTIHDGSGALAVFNSACSNLLGYDASELATMSSTALLHPSDSVELAKATERAYSAPEGSAATRLRLVRKDGSPVVVDIALLRVLIADRRYLVVESTPVGVAA